MNQMANVNKQIIEVTETKISKMKEAGAIAFPSDYSVENALKAAMFTLENTKDRSKRPALEVCDRSSIANALLDMTVQGLNVGKKQGYFIVQGNQLQFMRSYFGTLAVLQRVTDLQSHNAVVIYEGDNVSYELIDGEIENFKHSQQFGNINTDKMVGAYCILKFADGSKRIELMTMQEIRTSWGQSKTSREVHKKFPVEMAKRTVINRAAKRMINMSNDAHLYVGQQIDEEAAHEFEVQNEIEENNATVVIDMNDEVIENNTQEPTQTILHAEKAQEAPQTVLNAEPMEMFVEEEKPHTAPNKAVIIEADVNDDLGF